MNPARSRNLAYGAAIDKTITAGGKGPCSLAKAPS
jgi:hypothetical protein